MSSISNFVSAKPVPIGGILPLAGASGPNPTIDGAEYLKTSVLKAIAGYEGLLTSAVDMTVAVGTAGAALAAPNFVTAENGWTYAEIKKTADPINGSWATFISASALDSCRFGSRVVIVTNSPSTSIYSMLNGVSTTVALATTQLLCAANDAGTLGVTVNNLLANSGNITTSTDALNWTLRTPAGANPTGALVNCSWSQPGGLFLFMHSNGHVYTAADGYTLTDRGAIAGATAAALPLGISAFRARARSSTSTVFLLDLTIGGVAGQYIVRTTDGVTYSATLAAAALQLDGYAATPSSLQITYIAGKYVIHKSAASGVASSIYYTSSDDGLTWQKGSVPVNSAAPTSALAMLAPGNGSDVLAWHGTNSVSVLSGISATHVGIAKVLTDVAPIYVRIK